MLVTLIFPVEPPESRDRPGPPWPVSTELYTQLLTSVGFEAAILDKTPVSLSHANREGREWIGVWKRRQEREGGPAKM